MPQVSIGVLLMAELIVKHALKRESATQGFA
jgi:hypothetical protein